MQGRGQGQGQALETPLGSCGDCDLECLDALLPQERPTSKFSWEACSNPEPPALLATLSLRTVEAPVLKR